MGLHTEWLTFDQDGIAYRAYSARPQKAKDKLPSVLVLQEIWGVDAHIRDVTERYAAAGYWAVAPDLFSEDGERPAQASDERLMQARSFLHRTPQAFRDPQAREAALAALPQEEQTLIRESAEVILSSFARMETFKGIVHATFRWLSGHAGCTGRIAAAGYCMGGMLAAALAGAEPELAAAVVYYGRVYPELAPSTSCPVLGFFGGKDTGITSLVPAYEQAMQEHGKSFTAHIYEQAGHAFFNDTGAGYDVDAARDAWSRTLAFLGEQLV